MMKKLIIFLFAFSATHIVFAQYEKLLPPEGNPVLEQQADKQAEKPLMLGKAGFPYPVFFPVTDPFYGILPDTFYWVDNNVSVVQRAALFNAQALSGATYSNGDGTFGEADVLTSKTMNMNDVPDQCYFNFDYEMGSTWQSGDSLVLQAYNSAGNWDHIWRSSPVDLGKRNVTVHFPLGLLYKHATFKFRLVCYSNRSAGKTQNFRVYHFVFANRQQLPFYENVMWDTVHTSRNTWSMMQGLLSKDPEILWGNTISLDAFDRNGTLYNNGFNDTLRSHIFDLSTFAASDSVFFRFYYRSFTSSPTDSLLVQFKNNGGEWITEFGVNAPQSNGWKVFARNVNRNRFNHPAFEYRIITRGSATPNDTLKWKVSGFNIGKKLTLPFVDDFSADRVYPDSRRWQDKLVFINNTFPKLPPSINVATFDGLNRVGVPYGLGRGYCDTLTSQPIYLHGYVPADSVMLSFYIQPRGLGVTPDNGDSLMLFVRTETASVDSFRLLWKTGPAGLSKDSFTQVRITLPEHLLHDDFQLRFINKGSRTGNLNHWNLDYIYLHRNRTENDAITDIAIQELPSPLLRKYATMPYSHFKATPAVYTRDTQYFNLSNNSKQGYAIDYGRELFDHNYARIDSFGSVITVFPAQSIRSAGIKKNVNLAAGDFTTDSVAVHARYYTRLGTTFDNIRSNDTLWQSTWFVNYYAYDDGTAEAGYAIESTTGSVALRYSFAKPDSMYGMSVCFNRGKTDVKDLSFSLMVWRGGAVPETEVLRIPAKAVYYNARNGFHYVKFDQPVWVEYHIFIGWDQTQIFPLNVGFDLNYKVDDQYLPNPEMFYNVQGAWQQTSLWGALMMRPVVGKWIDPGTVGMKEAQPQLDVLLFPNPNNGLMQIRGTEAGLELTADVFDITGRKHGHFIVEGETLDLQYLAPGFYMIRVEDLKSGKHTTRKILISK